jgi:short-subunit dehydrogenase
MKNAIVAGASRGIGKSIVKALIDDGYNVIAISRNLNQLNDLQKYSNNIKIYQMNITNEDETKQFYDYIKDINIDLFVHNAGGNFANSDLLKSNINDWINTYKLNVIGPLNTAKIIMPKMKNQGFGTYIAITSLVGHGETYPGGAGYVGAKTDEAMFVKHLRNEFKRTGVRVIEIAPGTTKTETNNTSDGVESKDIAEAVRWSASLPQYVNIDLMIVNYT